MVVGKLASRGRVRVNFYTPWGVDTLIKFYPWVPVRVVPAGGL